jgi:hypothetical protein
LTQGFQNFKFQISKQRQETVETVESGFGSFTPAVPKAFGVKIGVSKRSVNGTERDAAWAGACCSHVAPPELGKICWAFAGYKDGAPTELWQRAEGKNGAKT